MHKSMLFSLRCPTCHSALGSKVIDEPAPGHVETGLLLCEKCSVWYPIVNHVPVMLYFSTKVHSAFVAVHDRFIPQGYTAPRGYPRAGDASVNETFTDEWNALGDDELSFSYTRQELLDLHGKVFLREANKVPHGGAILDMGCGRGREAEVLQELYPWARVWGVDLNLSMLRRDDNDREGAPQLVIASVFALPFNLRAFDLVFCQGVLHHTAKPAEAFKGLAEYVRPGGQFFVWVYSLESSGYCAGGLRRLVFVVGDAVVRPLLSRAPRWLRDLVINLLALVAYPLSKLGADKKRNLARWGLKNQRHALRDWLTPRHASVHKFTEVAEWFETSSFATPRMSSPSAFKTRFGTAFGGVGMLGTKRIVVLGP